MTNTKNRILSKKEQLVFIMVINIFLGIQILVFIDGLKECLIEGLYHKIIMLNGFTVYIGFISIIVLTMIGTLSIIFVLYIDNLALNDKLFKKEKEENEYVEP